jgi:hypothetical protein
MVSFAPSPFSGGFEALTGDVLDVEGSRTRRPKRDSLGERKITFFLFCLTFFVLFMKSRWIAFSSLCLFT